MNNIYITDEIKYIGVSDKTIKLFENQYILKDGMKYNSYLIDDEKIVIMDTVDKKKTEEWLTKIEDILNGRKPHYLLISHLEPDHSGSIDAILKKYPDMQIISNSKVFSMLPQFIDEKIESKEIEVKEGDTFSTGKHILQFIMTPMVHWPEVMMVYEQNEKILFSADAFGTFGISENTQDWADEARRYYINIVGKYGMQVQNVLKKIETIEIKTICPLHGPVLKEKLDYYINLYDIWSKYNYEEDGILIVCGSLHGNTLEVSKKMAKDLEKEGKKVKLIDISTTPAPDAVAQAFKYSKMILACSTYNMSIFPAMNSFLQLLKEKNYQKRIVGIIENGSWAPNAAKCIKEILNSMKDIEIIEPIVTIKTRLDKESTEKLNELKNKL